MWVELLAASCLMIAVAAVNGARCRDVLYRWLIVVTGVLAPAGCWAAVTFLAIWLRVARGVGPTARPWILGTMTEIFLIIALIIIIRGMRRRRAANWAAWKLSLVFAAVCVISLLTFWNLDLAARDRLGRLRDRADAIMAATFPPRIPDTHNAARVYEQAFKSLDMATDRKIIDWAIPVCRWLNSPEGAGAVGRPSDAQIRGILKKYERGLHQLRRAAAMKQCSFGIYWSSDELQNVLLAEVSNMRSASELLAADARIRATDGDAAGAVADLNALFAMAEHVTRKPTMITAMAAINIESRAAESMEFVLARCGVSESELASLKIEPLFSHMRVIRSALRSEEAFGLSALAKLGEPGVWAIPRQYLPEVVIPMYRVFLLDDEIEGYNVAVREWRKLREMPYYESRELWKTLPERIRMEQTGFFVTQKLPAVSRYPVRAAKGDARHRLARLAAAAEMFRIRTGALPENLDKLVPEYIEAIPTDPFDGKPLKMASNSDGAVIYSIGPDAKDDGGGIMPNGTIGDMVFRLVAKQ